MADRQTPAFPFVAEDESGIMINMGMTLRDYFAAKAMQGMLAACTGWSEQEQTRLAKCSYMMADEMMKAREA
jgi:hypothetical protein